MNTTYQRLDNVKEARLFETSYRWIDDETQIQ